jgi:MFS family permease
MFIGMTVGGWLWGSLADRYGRKFPLMIALAMNAAFGVMSAISVNYSMFLVFRVLSGVG